MRKRISGIYQIKNIINGKTYIGSSINVGVRWGVHRKHLRKGCHVNRHLQRAFQKHGEDAFVFQCLEIVEPMKCQLLAREQYWIDTTRSADPKIGYNLASIAGSTLGIKQSAEAIEKNRRCRIGKKLSKETREKMSEGRRGSLNSVSKLDEMKVLDIKSRLLKNESCHSIAKIFGVSVPVVHKIKTGQAWKHVAGESSFEFGVRAGEDHGMAKLCDSDVAQIKARLQIGQLCRIIASDYGVVPSNIRAIKQGRTWKHVLPSAIL